MYSCELVRLKNVIKNSYSPYSKFRVASMIFSKNGQCFIGTNIENSSYALTICAEAAAIANAITNGVKKGDISKVFIYSDTIAEIMPCGACRQILSEFVDNNTDIITIGKNEKIKKYKIDQILFNCFSLKI